MSLLEVLAGNLLETTHIPWLIDPMTHSSLPVKPGTSGLVPLILLSLILFILPFIYLVESMKLYWVHLDYPG